MKRRANALDFRGKVEHRHQAGERLHLPGQAVVVHRGVDRSLTMVCPDGCGETLTINLDDRSGPAWRLYIEGEAVSLYPSVWRNTGCCSHFILWSSRIYWCDRAEELQPTDSEFESKVLQALTATLRSFSDIAQELSVVPWAVLSACKHLHQRGLALQGTGQHSTWFMRGVTSREIKSNTRHDS